MPRIVADDRITHAWPPPGTTVVPLGFPESWVLVMGEVDGAEDGHWYMTTLEEMLYGNEAAYAFTAAKLFSRWTGSITSLGSTLGSWPIIYEVGKGNFMRWIRCTFRGDLAGGIEQFQHKLDLGLPGADPDLDAAECLELAEDLAGWWQTAWTAGMDDFFPTAVRYMEVGCVTLVQTDGTEVDGTGGNLSQEFETEWFPYPSGSRPTGVATTSLPFEVSAAVTLLTAHRGARGRGRFYLPPPNNSAMTENGLFATGFATAINAGITSLFNAIITNTPHVPVVVSRRGIILHEINEVLVGRVPDSQRRRRRSQDEARVVGYTL